MWAESWTGALPGLGETGSPPAVLVALNVPLVAGLLTNSCSAA